MRKRPTDDSQRHDAQCDDSQRDASQRSAAGHDNADAPLDERAVAAARAELRGERTGILGATGRLSLPQLDPPRRVPERWSFIHVMDRLEEAFRILRRLPISTRPRGYVTSMPFHVYDRADLNAQLETYELERLARLRNRVRIPPSPAEIARMEEALRWPAQFFDENQKMQERRYADQRVALGDLAQKLDKHAASIESIRPTVAALELARSKLVTWASIGFASVVLLGWIVEAAIKWAVTATLSHFQ
jgi:hypothetical protein